MAAFDGEQRETRRSTIPCGDDDGGHEWGQPRLVHGQPGTAMDGTWEVEECVFCTTGRLRSINGADAYASITAHLENLGCGPES
jgi:hypothetical protein